MIKLSFLWINDHIRLDTVLSENLTPPSSSISCDSNYSCTAHSRHKNVDS